MSVWNPLSGWSWTLISRRALTSVLMQMFRAVAVRLPVTVMVAIQGSQSHLQPFCRGSRDWGLRVIHSSLRLSQWGSSEAGCCGAVLADMPLQHWMSVVDSASGLAYQGDCPSIQKRGSQGVFHWLITLRPWECLFQGTGEETCWSLDSGGTMWLTLWLWKTGPAVFPPQGP